MDSLFEHIRFTLFHFIVAALAVALTVPGAGELIVTWVFVGIGGLLLLAAILLCIPGIGELIYRGDDFELWTTVSVKEKAIIMVAAVIISGEIMALPAEIGDPNILRGLGIVFLLFFTTIRFKMEHTDYDFDDVLRLYGDFIPTFYALATVVFLICALSGSSLIISTIVTCIPAVAQIVRCVIAQVQGV